MERKIKTLEGISNNKILEVFNQSFSDYFIPFQLTEEQLIQKMLIDKTDLSLSVGVFEDNKLIGFILHGFDVVNYEKVVYNAGTGVIPEKRGSGLTHQMYQFILPVLKKKGINTLVLEVISQNIQAIKSYKRSGFKNVRELLCFKGEINTLNTNKSEFEIKELPNYNWNILESFWDIQPTWQNSKSVLNELKHSTIALGAYRQNQLVGYVVYNPINKRIQQIAVSRDFRRKGIATSLFSEIIKTDGNPYSIINVDKSSKSLIEFLNKIGFQINLEQLEMKLQLKKNTKDVEG